jgi:hypothetical protein
MSDNISESNQYVMVDHGNSLFIPFKEIINHTKSATR